MPIVSLFLDYVNKKFLNCDGQSTKYYRLSFRETSANSLIPDMVKGRTYYFIGKCASVLLSVYIFLESVSRERKADHSVLLLNLLKVFKTHMLLHVQSPY